MCDTLIKRYSTSVIKDFMDRANGLKELKHNLTKGELKELFVSRVLRSFLPSQFDIGSGTIINEVAEQSRQTDIIIYDNRIMPPFIKEQSVGVFPFQSVIATVEIKTKLNKKELVEAENAAEILLEKVDRGPKVVYEGDNVPLPNTPLCAVFGFEGGVRVLNEFTKEANDFLEKENKHLSLICITGKDRWAKVGSDWSRVPHTETYNEVKRFIAFLVDNIRFRDHVKLKCLAELSHWDWLSWYIK
jgi:hypothetical protein